MAVDTMPGIGSASLTIPTSIASLSSAAVVREVKSSWRRMVTPEFCSRKVFKWVGIPKRWWT